MADTEKSGPREADFGYERVPWADKKARVRGDIDEMIFVFELFLDELSRGFMSALPAQRVVSRWVITVWCQ